MFICENIDHKANHHGMCNNFLDSLSHYLLLRSEFIHWKLNINICIYIYIYTCDIIDG